jgi:hypothetical protein
MPYQCVHCSRIIPSGSDEILKGCNNCSGKFFFYIKDEEAADIEKNKKLALPALDEESKKSVEKDVRSILKVNDEDNPVILDIESIRVLGPGKYELDLVSLINRKPIVFKVEEGKYLIDF